MKISVRSGDFQGVMDVGGDDRIVAHRLGCLQAVASGRNLGTVIMTSTHLDNPGENDDDLLTLTEKAIELIEK